MNRAPYWVFDASPLILLGKVGLLPLLAPLTAACVVPEAVVEEIEAGPAGDAARAWLASAAPVHVEPSPTHPVVAGWSLSVGETAAISFAYRHRVFEVVLDDGAARACALSLELNVRGTLGIFILAKREGHVPAVRPRLEALVEAGLHADEGLLRQTLRLAGET